MFVKENPPGNGMEAEGFMNFEEEYEEGAFFNFDYFRSYVEEKVDPRGIGTYKVPIMYTIMISVLKDPYMLLIFGRDIKMVSRILERLEPIEHKDRQYITFNPDFIEYLNTAMSNDPWYQKIFNGDLESRGRRGFAGKAHELTERYPDLNRRFNDLSKRVVFREHAEVAVALKEVVVSLRVYASGKVTVTLPGNIDVKRAIPLIGKAVDRLVKAQKTYETLRASGSP